jgi:glycolate oxidase
MTDNNKPFFELIRSKYGDKLILDTDRFPDYFRDASEIRYVPPAIFFALTEKDVLDIINDCRQAKIPIVFRGAGTGYTGGATPVSGGLVLSLEKLKKLELDATRKIAFCGPGVITIELMKKAEQVGLFYPPDPASYEESSLGGNVAECAGGLRCKKYGVTKDYVLGIRGITINGEILKTGVYSDGDLFDLSGPIIGSEGLLLAITEIAFRLIDRPRPGETALIAFDNHKNAAEAVSEITRRGIVPSVMEFMDGDSANCSLEFEKTADIKKAAAILLIETSGINSAEQTQEIKNIARKFHAVYFRAESDPQMAESLWKVRRNLSKAVKASAKQKISEDVCVPPSKLAELVEFIARLNAAYPIRINSYGHAGDGNLHVNFLQIEDDPAFNNRVNEAVERLFKKTLWLGGTLTGEHGVGLTKRDFLHLEFDPNTISAMRNIKDVFDAQSLLNPGKMFRNDPSATAKSAMPQ